MSYFLVVYSPEQPVISALAATATSLTLSWSIPSGPPVTSSEVMWRLTNSTDSENTIDKGSTTELVLERSHLITGTSYTIVSSESGTYSITVVLFNAAGSGDPSSPVTFSITTIPLNSALGIHPPPILIISVNSFRL